MAYEQKPNTFSLFKNEKKQAEKHPDYTGTFVDDQGREYFADAWIKRGQNNRTFMSGRIKLKDKQKSQTPAPPNKETAETHGSEIPF